MSQQVIVAGILLGIGLGGFFDGIILHQVLQWHHMLSAVQPTDTVAGWQVNTLADGLFHMATLTATAVGVFMLWNAARVRHEQWSEKLLVGLFLIGWGGFNLVEGLVDHHILGLHHVRPGPEEALWDIAFLAWGAAMLIGGLLLVRRGYAESPEL